MRNIYILLVIATLLASCGGGDNQKSIEKVIEKGNLEEIRAKRASIVNEQQALVDKLKQLDEAISKLDTVKKAPLITTFQAKQEVFNHYLEIQGNVTTKNMVVIFPEYAGLLTNVYVKEGQYVKKGQLLAKIDDGGLSQQLSQMRIQEALAKTTFERQERLWNQKIGSEIQYLQAKSNYEAQATAVKQLEQQLAKTRVTAPFSGTIDEVITDQGTVVAPGQSQLMRLVNLNNMYVEADIPERYLGNVTKGKKVTVEFPVLGTKVESNVRQTSNYINPANRTFKVEIGVPNKDNSVKPNLTAKLKINDYTNENALLVPQSIISENAKGEQYVYVVKDKNGNNEGIAKRAIIKTGKTQGDVIEITSGIENGAEIIQEGARSVRDGQTVKVINQ
jgi:RND family efflux transporter MFP subunit